MDIDKFKVYNDTFGHHQGDIALRTFAETAANTLQRSTDFLARWGGEEFVILLPNTDSTGAAEVAENVRKAVEEVDVPTEDGEITKLTVSIGINSVIPDANTSSADFMNQADQALYKAKEQGRNRSIQYEP